MTDDGFEDHLKILRIQTPDVASISAFRRMFAERPDDAKNQAGHGNPKVAFPHGEAPGRSSVRPVATRAAALLYCSREWIPASAGMAKVTEWLVEPVGRRGWVLSSMTRPSSRRSAVPIA